MQRMTCSSTVRAGALYAKGYRFESGRANVHDDLAQLVEQYPDTVQVDSSSLSVITLRPGVRATHHAHKVSIPVLPIAIGMGIATNWFVTQLDQSTGLLHREL